MTTEMVFLTCEVCGEKWGSVTKCELLDKLHCGFCCPKYSSHMRRDELHDSQERTKP